MKEKKQNKKEKTPNLTRANLELNNSDKALAKIIKKVVKKHSKLLKRLSQ